MQHDEVAVVFRVSPAERLILGTLVPAGLAAVGYSVLFLTNTWLFPAMYGVAGIVLWIGIRRARLEVDAAGITRIMVRRRFVAWHDIREVTGGHGSGGERGYIRLRSGELFRLGPLGADRGTNDYDVAVRVIHAAHLRTVQSAAAGLEQPLRITPNRTRRALHV